MEKKTLICSICAKELDSKSIGLLLRGRLICCTCESSLVGIKVTDREYPWYMEKIKSILIS